MKNFKIKGEDGKEYWISRSMAVHCIIECHDLRDGSKYALVIRRGSGCPDHRGKLADVTGYIDWDESAEQAVERELWEEIGLKLTLHDKVGMELVRVKSDPSQPHQNITLVYRIYKDYREMKEAIESGILNCNTVERGGEPNEVEEITFIPLTDPSYKIDPSEFAFDHGIMFQDMIKNDY